MLGYWGKPKDSAAVLSRDVDGKRTLCTGDWFWQDKDGDLYFVGRSDDIIKTRGEKVAPLEVERALLAVDGVSEAAVLGVPDKVLGEAVQAWVVLAPGAQLSEQEIRRVCAKHVESFMVPTKIFFLDQLPKLSNLKVDKSALQP